MGNDIYYTSTEGSQPALLGVRKSGGPITNVLASALAAPNDCEFDGDATVYVADAQANAVYSLAVSSHKIRQAGAVRKLASFERAAGVGVFVATERSLRSGAGRRGFESGWWTFLAGGWVVGWSLAMGGIFGGGLVLSM